MTRSSHLDPHHFGALSQEIFEALSLCCRGCQFALVSVSRAVRVNAKVRPGSDDTALSARIHEIHHRSRETYGLPMIHAELADDYGIRLNERTVIIRGS
jgi:hypothetical protein